jgi:hypothetical protein
MADKLPEHAKRFASAPALYQHLRDYHGISEVTASERLHKLKQQCGYGAADNPIFDRTGNLYDPITLEWVGSLTEGGGG